MPIDRGEWTRIIKVNADICGVYAIIHEPSGQAYIGSSSKTGRRWGRHLARLSSGRHHSPRLLELWLADGPGAFVFTILEQCAPDDLVLREQTWADGWPGPILNAGAIVASPMRGAHHSEDARHRVSLAHRGGTRSTEWRARVSASLKGHQVSGGARAKMRAAWRSNDSQPPRTTPESAAKSAVTRRMRHQAMGAAYYASPQYVERQRSAKKMGLANRGRVHTVATRARVSAAIQAWWNARKTARSGECLL